MSEINWKASNLENWEIALQPMQTQEDEKNKKKKRKKEYTIQLSKTLIDVFEPKGRGSFSVKKDSKILGGHIRLEEPLNGTSTVANKATEFPITPWITLQELLLHYNKINPTKNVISTKFLFAALPNQKLSIQGTNIYADDKKIVDLEPEGNKIIPSTLIMPKKKYTPVELQTEHLLQKPPFRFVDSIEIEEGTQKPKRWTQFQWSFTIPEDFPWQNDGSISPGILIEFAGQTWSAVISPYLNTGKPSIKNPKNKEETIPNAERQFFTFESSRTKSTSVPVKAGDTLMLTGKILKYSPEKKDDDGIVRFCYTIQNASGKKLLSWEMEGKITFMRVFSIGFRRHKGKLEQALKNDIYKMAEALQKPNKETVQNTEEETTLDAEAAKTTPEVAKSTPETTSESISTNEEPKKPTKVAISDNMLLEDILSDEETWRTFIETIQTRFDINLYTPERLEKIAMVRTIGDLIKFLNQEINDI